MALIFNEQTSAGQLTYHRISQFKVLARATMVEFTLESFADRGARERLEAPGMWREFEVPFRGGDVLPQAYAALTLSPDWRGAQSDAAGELVQAAVMAVALGAAQWDEAASAWVFPGTKTLNSAKADAWSAIKMARANALMSPLVTPHGTFDCSPQSQDNIMRAYLFATKLAELGQPSDVSFTLANNTRPTFTVQQITSVAIAMGAREKQAYDLAATLRTQIDAAQTIEEAEAITWPQN
jgi:hypothetical protein